MEKRYWVRALPAVTLGTAALLGLAACGGASAGGVAEAAEEVVVLGPEDIAVAEVSEVAAGVALTGSLQPYRRADVLAQVPGTVASIRQDRGDAVRQGAVLATIQADGIRSQAAGAQAGVAAAEAGLALARQQLESARTLHEAGAMADLDLQSAEAAYEAAVAQLAAAKAQAASAGESARHTTIVAPFTGVVSDRVVELGEAVNPGQRLFTVVNSAYLELAGQIPVEAAGSIRVGQPVAFELKAYPGQEFRGTVDRIDPVADPSTRQVGIRVRLPNPEGRIVGGQFATGRVLAERAEQAIVVAESAIRETAGETHVLVIEDGKIVRRPVTLGARDPVRGVVAILSGLEAGEQVLASPGASLPAGTKVRVENARTGGPTRAAEEA